MWTINVVPYKHEEFPTGIFYWANSGGGIVKMVDQNCYGIVKDMITTSLFYT